MFAGDHAPPHFHALYAELEALIDLRDLSRRSTIPSPPDIELATNRGDRNSVRRFVTASHARNASPTLSLDFYSENSSSVSVTPSSLTLCPSSFRLPPRTLKSVDHQAQHPAFVIETEGRDPYKLPLPALVEWVDLRCPQGKTQWEKDVWISCQDCCFVWLSARGKFPWRLKFVPRKWYSCSHNG
jgi:hypothetical protein